jgi:hypothetical protein
MDAGNVAGRAMGPADGEVVWAGYPDADIKLATMLCIAPVTETIKPGLRGEHEGNR